MRLIDADKLIEDYIVEDASDFSEVISRFDVNNAPTVDAVEVVRCKDCINYHDEEGVGWCELNSKVYSSGEWDMWDADDYCSRGERKENADS